MVRTISVKQSDPEYPPNRLFANDITLTAKGLNIFYGGHGVGKTVLFNLLALSMSSFSRHGVGCDYFKLLVLPRTVTVSVDGNEVTVTRNNNNVITVTVNGSVTTKLTPHVIPFADYVSVGGGGDTPYGGTPPIPPNPISPMLTLKPTDVYYIPQLVTPSVIDSVANTKLTALRKALTRNAVVIVDDIDAYLTEDDIDKVADTVKGSNAQLFVTVYRDYTVKRLMRAFNVNDVTITLVTEKGIRQYADGDQVKKLDTFEKPLRWLGYV